MVDEERLLDLNLINPFFLNNFLLLKKASIFFISVCKAIILHFKL